MDTYKLERQAQKEAAGFVITLLILIVFVLLMNGCSLLTSEQKEQIKDQVNKPENQEKVIEQINEVLK